MSVFQLHTNYKKLLADTVTPVSIYLRLRDRFAHSLLLESSDYHGADNTYSFICFEPIGSIEVAKGEATLSFPDHSSEKISITDKSVLPAIMQQYLQRFQVQEFPFKFSYNGLFGYQSYDTVRHYEDVEISSYKDDQREIPDMLYYMYRYIIVVNHFNNELYIFEHGLSSDESEIEHIEALLSNPTIPSYNFELLNQESSNMSDEDYLEIVNHGIEHCRRGDVFQIVLSRQFNQGFRGDEFNVYRQLRSINPSPYLFYCDFGSFKLMGSSPEAQLVIEDGQAIIHPIAGTFRRTGNDEEDTVLARKLFDDPKENAEHVMLVDLARNDLSRSGHEVNVGTFKEIQFYSHVIHLVSRVSARIREDVASMQLVADTFPAGTLSGAPKHRAMQLIDQYENQNRGFYGGCVGYLGFNGNFNHAIIIRSLLSKNNKLFYQAGAGIVSKSVPESELQEVNNKLMAVRTAMIAAHRMHAQEENKHTAS